MGSDKVDGNNRIGESERFKGMWGLEDRVSWDLSASKFLKRSFPVQVVHSSEQDNNTWNG